MFHDKSAGKTFHRNDTKYILLQKTERLSGDDL